MLTDYHIHTYYSDDSAYEMESVVREAIGLGLDEICFTDHVDYGVKQDHGKPEFPMRYLFGKPMLNVDYPAYFEEIARLREKYAGQIVLKQGMEFGVQTHTAARFEALYNSWAFDFILLSIHQVGDKEFWPQDYQKGKTQKEYNDGYYQEMYDVVRAYHDYSVLAHMDMIRRYDDAGFYPLKNNWDVITEILRYIIADGKGLEVNTSCFRYGIGDLTPATDILRLYRSLGGEILTLGSDAHEKGQLGCRMAQTQQTLKALGFDAVYTYEKMRPVRNEI